MKLSNSSLLTLAIPFTTALSTAVLSPFIPLSQATSPRSIIPNDNIIAPWHITKFTSHNSNKKPPPYKYTFSISGGKEATIYKEPIFSSTCIISPLTQTGGPCNPSSVTVTKIEQIEKDVVLFLEHVYISGEARYTVMGNITIVSGEKTPRSFQVVPTSISAIA